MPRRRLPGSSRVILVVSVLAVALLGAGLGPNAAADEGLASHLLIGEVMTGGVGASDEFVELVNPSSVPMPLARLELVYVSAGGSLSVRVAWDESALPIPPGGTLLLANEAGAYAAMADAMYAGGLAAGGGAVGLRRAGESGAIDAVGWGSASGAWVEGSPATAPPAGSSLARVRVVSDGPFRDTGDNATDFAVGVPSPQAAGAEPPLASAAPIATATAPASVPPTATPAASPTTIPTPTAEPTASPTAVPIATARGLPDGTSVTVGGVALTGSAFHDGGGYLADATGGVAVIVDGGLFAAGTALRVTGSIEDRFAQRTLRVDAADLVPLAPGAVAPAPQAVGTGSVGEAVEGELVRIAGTIEGSPSALTAGLAFDVDDGSGAVRVIVWSALGIDTSSWVDGARVELHGVVGQRDSSGSGAAGYRVQPRSQADVVAVTQPAQPTARPSAAASASPSPTSASAPISLAEARSAAPGTALTVRGVVTLGPGVVDAEVAVIQESGAAILLRIDPGVAGLARGTVVEVSGIRSTRSGMETIRVTDAPRTLGSAAEPAPVTMATGGAGESLEARLVRVTGELPESARRAASGTVSFDVDDGSGRLRVVIPASLAAGDEALVARAIVEVTGILGQETTGAMPSAGYRLWPRSVSEVRVVETPARSGSSTTSQVGQGAQRPPVDRGAVNGDAPTGTLGGVGTIGLADLRIGATLVAGPWPELGLGGLLWDGAHLVGLSADSAAALADVGARRPPLALELAGLRAVGVEIRTGIPLVALSREPGAIVAGEHGVAAPRGSFPEADQGSAWVTLVGRTVERDGGHAVRIGQMDLRLDLRCSAPSPLPIGTVAVTGIAIADSGEIVVPCDGLRAAPTLTRQVITPAAGPESPGRARMPKGGDPGPRPAETSLEARRILAAGLLGLGTVALLGTALGWRGRSATLEPPGDLPREGEEEDTTSGFPQMRLITLRRDARD